MLNELFGLYRGLADNGADFGSRHGDIKDMGRATLIRVRLDAAGAITGIELVTASDRSAQWTLRDGQQNGFPGLKTARGLLSLQGTAGNDHDKAWRSAKTGADKRSELLRLLGEYGLDKVAWPKDGHRLRIGQRLEQLRRLADDPRTAAVPAAFERFLKALARPEPFSAQLVVALAREVREGDEFWLDPARAALIGPAALAIDVADDPDRFDRDAGDPRQVEAVGAALAGGTNEGLAGNCAFTGPCDRLLAGNFPQPNLPTLGQTYIFARNSDIPAMSRYGRSASRAMPIAEDLAGRLSGALLALTTPERMGKTWQSVPAEKGDKPDLLIACLPSNLEQAFARELIAEGPLGAESDDDDVIGWPALQTAGAPIFQSLLKGEVSSDPDEIMRLVLIRTVDPANRKVILERQLSVRTLRAAAEEWVAAMRNVPGWIAYLVPVGDQTGAARMRLSRPLPQAPLTLVSLSRQMFLGNGSKSTDAVGITASEALSLFLHEGYTERRARRALSLILARHHRLLLGVRSASLRGGEALRDFDRTTRLRLAALRSIAWIGALLKLTARPKEDYMHDIGFKLGQLLAAADIVHIGYCADLRRGQVPPTLIGNSVFAVAGVNPIRALQMLQTRWKPYGAWARRQQEVRDKAQALTSDEKSPAKDKERGWAMRRGLAHARRIAPLCSELGDTLSRSQEDGTAQPYRLNERFRAELLLGYIAGLQPEIKPATSTAQHTADIEQGDME